MIYVIYVVFILLSAILINPNIPKKIYCIFKVDSNYIAGLFASLGISALANKIDFILYWDAEKLIKYKFSIFFAIIMILMGLWLFTDKDK